MVLNYYYLRYFASAKNIHSMKLGDKFYFLSLIDNIQLRETEGEGKSGCLARFNATESPRLFISRETTLSRLAKNLLEIAFSPNPTSPADAAAQ